MKLLQDLSTREALEVFGSKAEKITGLESLRIGSDQATGEALRLSHNDMPALRVPPDREEPNVEVARREAWLKIVSSHFRDGYKWRFTDGGERPFTAEMEDLDFMNRVLAGDVTLNANDALRCRLREEQALSSSNLVKTIYVEEVLDHRPGARQLGLL